MRLPALDRSRLLAAVVLSACVGLAGGALAAWGIYSHFGPAERVVTQTITTQPGQSPGTSLTVAAVAQQKASGVVEVVTQPIDTTTLRTGGARGFASGFVVSADGLIVTTVHAVEGATALRVTTADGRGYDATIVRADAAHGVVLLRASGAQGLTPLTMAGSAAVPGDLVIAVARPPFSSLLVSSGTVSGTSGTITLADGEPTLSDVTTVDDIPDPRQDGAPLLNGGGDVVGVVVAAGAASPGVVALSAPAATALVNRVNGGAAQPALGAHSLLLDPATAAAAGAPAGGLILSVDAGGPAALAGLSPGDVVTEVDGSAVDSARPFDAVALGLEPEQQITLSVWRSGTTLTLVLTVGAA